MTATCTNCNAEIGPDDRFCGECGALVQSTASPPQTPVEKTTTPIAAPSERSDPPPASEPAKKNFGADSRKGIILIGSAAAIDGIVFFSTRETPYPGRSGPPQAVSRPMPSASPDESTLPKAKVPSATAPGPSGSSSVNAYIDRIRSAYRSTGIEKMAPYQLTVPSCGACIPFMIYCTSKISGVNDLGGKKVKVQSDEADQLVRSVGGSPQLLSLLGTMRALEQNIIQCAIAGGGKPK